MRFVALGLGLGLVCSVIIGWAASEFLGSFLFHVSPLDPISYLGSMVLLGLVGLGGCAGPARWASRIDPAVALRRHGAMLELLPRRTRTRSAIATAVAQPKSDLAAGVAVVAAEAADWREMFGSMARFIAESCNVESATLLARSADGLRFESLDECPLCLPATAFVVRRLEHLQSMLPVNEGDFAAWQRAAASPEREEEIRILADAGARFLVPIRSGLKLTGLLVLGAAKGLPPAPRPLQSLAAQLGLLLENSRLAQRAAEAQFLRQEVDVASEVQRRLLPLKPPDVPGMALAGLCQPALGVGGDYFDYFSLDGNRVAFLVADVAGKGIGAALVVSLLYSALRTLAPKANGNVAAMVGELNRLLQRATQPRAFATLFYAEYEPGTRELTYCNAAHMPPLLRRNGGVERLAGGGLVVGMFARAQYQQHTATLEPGDRLLIYSDGVTESPNASGDDFGEDSLKAALLRAPEDAGQAAAGLIREVEEFAGRAEAFDDLTVLVVDLKA